MPDGVYVDATFGGGGHSREILNCLGENGRLIAFDQDPNAARNVPNDSRFALVPQNFKYLKNWLSLFKVSSVNGILADLGVSSHQFDESARGFSIRFDSPLDMRMNPAQELSALQVVNDYSEAQLAVILGKYGEIERPFRVARMIIQSRPIATTVDLMNAVKSAAPKFKDHKFYAQLFQAVRIEVNDELTALKEFLEQSKDCLVPGGRLVIISYHSLEDRMVKDFLRSGNVEGVQAKDLFGNLIRPFKPVYSKAIIPEEAEIAGNSRARSAKLRAGEKLESRL